MASVQVRDILHEATLDVPTAVASPPLSAIHRRVTRRRAAYSVSGAFALVAIAASLIPFVTKNSSPPVAPPSPTASSALAWHIGEIADDDRTITLFVEPPEYCHVIKDPKVAVTKNPDGNLFSFLVTGTKTKASDCSRSGGPKVVVTLEESLQGRRVVDGSANFMRTVISRREVPMPPPNSGWHEVPRNSLVTDKDWWEINYTKPGGPDIHITAAGGRIAAMFPGDEQISVGARTVIVRSNGHDYHLASWQSQNAGFDLSLSPAEGQTLTKQEFVDLLKTLIWP